MLPRLTLEGKIGQISGGAESRYEAIDPTGTFTTETARAAFGQMENPETSFPAKRSAILRNSIQRYQREKSRLGIPALFMGEGLHGFMEDGSTSFPQVIGLASTFDPALIHQIFTVVGDEAGSRGAGQVFSPVLDLARDPRWGRTEETYGEDPFLVSRMGVNAIEGLQGESFMIGRHHVMATAKHFAVHGQPEGGTNTAPANYSERIIRENFLLPFQAAVEEAHVGSVMASYNEIDGVPSHINHWLLGACSARSGAFRATSLRTATAYRCCGRRTRSRQTMPTRQAGHQCRRGLRSVGWVGVSHAALAGEAGPRAHGDVDRAVSKVLAAKFRLGLFEDPYVDADYAERTVNSAEHRKLR